MDIGLIGTDRETSGIVENLLYSGKIIPRMNFWTELEKDQGQQRKKLQILAQKSPLVTKASPRDGSGLDPEDPDRFIPGIWGTKIRAVPGISFFPTHWQFANKFGMVRGQGRETLAKQSLVDYLGTLWNLALSRNIIKDQIIWNLNKTNKKKNTRIRKNFNFPEFLPFLLPGKN